MSIGEIEPHELPWDIDKALGDIRLAELLCPGVYYICLYAPYDGETEFHLVDVDSESVSDAAKAYGHRIDDIPTCLIYPYRSELKGYKILDYEIQRYYVSHNHPKADSRELREAAAYATEICPEYFGGFFPPVNTPFGHIVRHKTLMNGIFWAETDTAQQIIVVAFPRWLDVFTDYALRWVKRVERDKGGKKDATFEYFCFPEVVFPVVLFELIRYYPDLEDSPCIDVRALMNTLYRDFTDYTIAFNSQEQTGVNDMPGLLMRAMGFDVELNGSPENMISFTEGAGYQYLRI